MKGEKKPGGGGAGDFSTPLGILFACFFGWGVMCIIMHANCAAVYIIIHFMLHVISSYLRICVSLARQLASL